MKITSKLLPSTRTFCISMLIFVFAIRAGYSQNSENNSYVGAIKADVETVMKASKSLEKYLTTDKINKNRIDYFTWVIVEFGSVSEANSIWNRLRANTQQHFKSNNKANIGGNELKEFYLEISGIIRKIESSGTIPGPTFCYDKYVEDNYLALAESILAGSALGGIADGVEVHIVAWEKANANFEKCMEVNY
ncbi:MAG: hypothetical protein IPI60_00590 [Saprospiraceae bacterium]|nr:hypothetical protein [Saprospiraceae bacterium]